MGILQQLSEMLIAQEFDCMLKVPKNGSFGGSYGLMTALNGDILTLVSCRGIPVLSQYAPNVLQHQPNELQIRARTEDIRWARATVVPLKVHLPEKPIISIAR
jgi:hypothetical protein